MIVIRIAAQLPLELQMIFCYLRWHSGTWQRGFENLKPYITFRRLPYFLAAILVVIL